MNTVVPCEIYLSYGRPSTRQKSTIMRTSPAEIVVCPRFVWKVRGKFAQCAAPLSSLDMFCPKQHSGVCSSTQGVSSNQAAGCSTPQTRDAQLTCTCSGESLSSASLRSEWMEGVLRCTNSLSVPDASVRVSWASLRLATASCSSRFSSVSVTTRSCSWQREVSSTRSFYKERGPC